MRLTFIYVGIFAQDCRRLKISDDDLRQLENELMKNPITGAAMGGTGGLRKVRFAPPSWHTGKSGAARVCYLHLPEVRSYLFRHDVREK